VSFVLSHHSRTEESSCSASLIVFEEDFSGLSEKLVPMHFKIFHVPRFVKPRSFQKKTLKLAALPYSVPGVAKQ
jgi:hypothetical protein